MVNFGVPERIVLELARLHGASVFVETGTYRGDTAKWASAHFAEVYTIENSAILFDQYSAPLNALRGVHALCGDSRKLLPEILTNIGQKSAVHWLDSHWFGGDTGGGEQDQCPLMGELECLFQRTQDIILIDDARLFLSAPPMPHKPALWPTIFEVMKALSVADGDPFVQIVDDVIFIVPDLPHLRDSLTAWAKRRSNKFWQAYQTWKQSDRPDL
jgi:hypothetical protein